MIDFTNMPQRNKAYAGRNGSKISILYNDELYMLKFPALPTKKTDLSYANSCISEYIGCKIFESVGIPVQDVTLGLYTVKGGKEKIVVACKDFTADGSVLQDFASLKNQIVDSEHNGYGTELADILAVFTEQSALDPALLSERFWEMFIVDALIGNWDRHNGNWGFLYDRESDHIRLAPVFDCGSSLFPQANEEIMKKVLSERGELHHRVFNLPRSAITENGERINYYDFISSLKNKDCNNALIRVKARLDMDRVRAVVDETPLISDLQKQFLKVLLTERDKTILERPLNHLIKE
ncbi:MAG: HipA domain-containing protein [Bacteroides sp.]|nr:HipA domain-containing protein [Eubacterium sp.]MCM1419036.1 HipA domain-containing protein [Roseburia sp.]MCM1463400.1 HipA domain-containing protein [Bacteroides sp.]